MLNRLSMGGMRLLSAAENSFVVSENLSNVLSDMLKKNE